MTNLAKATVAFGASRIAYAVALSLAPGRVGSPWLGQASAEGGGRVAARALAGRDGAFGVGIVWAVLEGKPVRPWLYACVASDVMDMAATVADRQNLPSRSAPATVAVAGGAALAGAALALNVED